MEHFESRRYLTSFDSSQVPQVFCDVLVIGSGVAGLSAALSAVDGGDVLLIAKGPLDESNTAKAQGGIAGAMAPDDSPAAHMADTIATGQGICNTEIVRVITAEAPDRIRELISWGAKFDEEGGTLALAREGGHSASRIVRAMGDATGKEVALTLIRRVRNTQGIQLVENAFVVDLITTPEDGCCGALLYDQRWGLMIVWAKSTILASGGAGRIFRETTNSTLATGDGLGMAYRAEAKLTDMEFYQFHPTALYVAGAARALISEAVRGEGGILLNARNERFMSKYHELAELAPRDTVSRAIVNEIRETGHTCAYLDMRHIPNLAKRFPGIKELCEQFDIDITRKLVPIRPAAHYMVGGIKADIDGTCSIPRLFACGEVACTGLHGANRMGSNSLLEGLVVGRRAGFAARRIAGGPNPPPHPRFKVRNPAAQQVSIDVEDVTNALRALAWRNVGIERSRFGLEETVHMLHFWGRYIMDKEFSDRAGWELQNMLVVARLIAESATLRAESRGVHYRTDFPRVDDEHWKAHIILRRQAKPELEPVR